MKPEYWDDAAQALARRDPVLRRLRARYPDISLVPPRDAFTTLARAIAGQQISVKAAQTIWLRVVATSGGKPNSIKAPAILALPDDALRGCGLSTRKAEYVRDLAARFVDGRVRPRRWPALDDEAVIEELVTVKGIGRWTAEMFLMFSLMRPNILPVDDVGLQRAMALHYNDGKPLSAKALRKIGDAWAPWRSVATWYLWRSLQAEPAEY